MNNQLTLFSRQLAYMLAQITDVAARAIFRKEDTENGFEIWRRLHKQFSLPERARSTNLLNEIIGFRLKNDHLESGLSELIILENRHENTTGRPLDDDLLATLQMLKTAGPLEQHLRLNLRNSKAFTEASEIIYGYIKSRHLTVPSGRTDYQGQADMEIGALKGKKGQRKGQGHKGSKRMHQGKRQGYALVQRQRNRQRQGQRKQQRIQRTRKRKEGKGQRTRMLSVWRSKPLEQGMPGREKNDVSGR